MELVNGAVPADQLERHVRSLRRHPWHPGRLFRESCLRGGAIPLAEAARRLGVEPADLDPVIEGRASLTPELALRIELAGWPRADIWTRQQAVYDLAQARLRIERGRRKPTEAATQASGATRPLTSL